MLMKFILQAYFLRLELPIEAKYWLRKYWRYSAL